MAWLLTRIEGALDDVPPDILERLERRLSALPPIQRELAYREGTRRTLVGELAVGRVELTLDGRVLRYTLHPSGVRETLAFAWGFTAAMLLVASLLAAQKPLVGVIMIAITCVFGIVLPRFSLDDLRGRARKEIEAIIADEVRVAEIEERVRAEVRRELVGQRARIAIDEAEAVEDTSNSEVARVTKR